MVEQTNISNNFVGGSTSGGKIIISPSSVISIDADIREIIISDKSERELYWEKFKKLVKK